MVKWQCVEYGKPFSENGDAGEFGELLYTSKLKGEGKTLLQVLNPIRRGGFLQSLGKVSAVCLQREPDAMLFAHLQARRDNALNYTARSRQSFFQTRFTQLRHSELRELYCAGHAPLGDIFYRDILEKTGVSDSFLIKAQPGGENRPIQYTPPNLPYYKDVIRVISPKRGVAAEAFGHSLLFRWLAAGAPTTMLLEEPTVTFPSRPMKSKMWIGWVDRIIEALLALPTGGQLQIAHNDLPIGLRLSMMQAVQRLTLPILGHPVTFALDVVSERSRHASLVQFTRAGELQPAKVGRVLELTDADPQPNLTLTDLWRDLSRQGVRWAEINKRWFAVEPLLQARAFEQAGEFLLDRYPAPEDAAQHATFLIELHCLAPSDQTPLIIKQQYELLPPSEQARLLRSYSAEILNALADQALSHETFEAWGQALLNVPPAKLEPRYVDALRLAFVNFPDAQRAVCRSDSVWAKLGSHAEALLACGDVTSADLSPAPRRALTVWLMRLLRTHRQLLPKLIEQELPQFAIADVDEAASYYQQFKAQVAQALVDNWTSVNSTFVHDDGGQQSLNRTLYFLLSTQVKLAGMTNDSIEATDLVQLLQLQRASAEFVREAATALFDGAVAAAAFPEDTLIQTLHLLTDPRADARPLLHMMFYAPEWGACRQELLAVEAAYDFSADIVSSWLQHDDSSHIVFHTLVWLPTTNRVNWQLLHAAALLPDVDEAWASYQHLLATSRVNDLSQSPELTAWLKRRDNHAGSFHQIALPVVRSNHLFFLAMWEWLSSLPTAGLLSAEVQIDIEMLYERAVAAHLPDVQTFGSHDADTVLFLTQSYQDKEAPLRKKALAALFEQPQIIEPVTWQRFFTNGYGFRLESYLDLLTALAWSADRMAIGLNVEGIIDTFFETFGHSAETFTFLQQFVDGGYSVTMLATICQRIAQLPDDAQQAAQYQFWLSPYANALNRQATEQIDLSRGAAQQPELFKRLYDFVTGVENRADFKLPTDADFEWRQTLAKSEQRNRHQILRFLLLIGFILIVASVAFYFLRSN